MKISEILDKLALPLALLNLAFFGLMFILMNYYELIGADPAYFDAGTENNLQIINSILGIVGLEVEPSAKVTTLGYAITYGFALAAAFFTILLVNRKELEAYEVTDAKA